MTRILLIAIIAYLLAGCNVKAVATGDVYQTLITSIKEADTESFDKNIGMIVNIDSLIPFDENGAYTLLGYACKYKNLSALQKLLERQADMAMAFEGEIYQHDALYVAIDAEDQHIVEYILRKGTDVNRIYTEDGYTALCAACQRGNLSIATKLLEHGADVNGAGDCGGDYILYPLFSAVGSGNPEVVKLLLEHGADINAVNKQSETAFNLLSLVEHETARKAILQLLQEWQRKSELKR